MGSIAHEPEDSVWRSYRHDAETQRGRRLDVYYRVVGEDPEFRRHLADLVTELRVAAGDGSDVIREYLHGQYEPSPGNPEDSAEAFLWWHARDLPAEVRVPLDAFADRWRLPRLDAVVDLWRALKFPREGEAVTLRLSWRVGPMRTYESEEEQADGSLLVTQRTYGMIWPLCPLPFFYDPKIRRLGWAREYAEDLATKIRDNILEQIAAIDAEAKDFGFLPIPPWHKNESELRRQAQRLYRAAVLGWGNERINGAEAREYADDDSYKPCTPQAVSKSVNDWARELGVPLPKR